MAEATAHWLITPAWLREHEACRDGCLAAGDRDLTIPEAVMVAFDYERTDWAHWVLAQVLRDLPPRDVVLFACRRARSVPQTPAGEAPIALAERWAAGEPVSKEELFRSADAAVALASSAAALAASAAELAVYAAAWAANAAYEADDHRASWRAAAEDAQALADQFLVATASQGGDAAVTDYEAAAMAALIAVAAHDPDHAAGAKQVAAAMGARTHPAAVGGALARMVRRGLLEIVSSTPQGARRYGLTARGEAAGERLASAVSQ